MSNDVLILMDSCHFGGTILSSWGSSSCGRTEIIAACSYLGESSMPTPGNYTFTRALIDELEDRLGFRASQPFTAATLHRGMSEKLIRSGLED